MNTEAFLGVLKYAGIGLLVLAALNGCILVWAWFRAKEDPNPDDTEVQKADWNERESR